MYMHIVMFLWKWCCFLCACLHVLIRIVIIIHQRNPCCKCIEMHVPLYYSEETFYPVCAAIKGPSCYWVKKKKKKLLPCKEHFTISSALLCNYNNDFAIHPPINTLSCLQLYNISWRKFDPNPCYLQFYHQTFSG